MPNTNVFAVGFILPSFAVLNVVASHVGAHAGRTPALGAVEVGGGTGVDWVRDGNKIYSNNESD